MKLLFLTQVLDAGDAVLGFVPRWVRGLAQHCERVRVVALELGDVAGLPANVDTREIGRHGVLGRYLRYRSVLREALSREHFDTVLSHMVPRYALVAAAPARRAGARSFLWYTHKGVDARLLKACERVEKVFTASSESLRVDTPRKVVTGHGIDLEHFRIAPLPAGTPRLLSVGRITPAKDPLTIVEALAVLRAEGREVALDLVGGGLAAGDAEYGARLARRIEELGLSAHVARPGEVPYPRVPACYAAASVVVNSSHTGSIDKVVLEAFACGRPVLSCNESIPPLLAALGARARELYFAPGDARGLARGIARVLDLPPAERAELGATLRREVALHHEVDALMARLVREMGGAPEDRGIGGTRMKLSIVIPSWNTSELLRACLASLQRAQLPEHETIVIDNASADGSADMVAAEFPAVVLQRNARNEGFAIGCNQGLRRASGEYLFLLNADTECAPDAIARMLAFLDAHPGHAAVAPRLVSADGTTQRTCLRFPNWSTPLWFGGPLERWFPNNFEMRRYFMREWDQQSSRDVDQPPAAALIVRATALAEVGLFDEALWLFYNDVDLSVRLAAAGWKTHYLAEAEVLHHIGASTRQFGNFLPEWHKNRLHYYRKHHGWLAGVWVKLCTGIAALDWSSQMLLRRMKRQPSEPIAPLWQKYWTFVRL